MKKTLAIAAVIFVTCSIAHSFELFDELSSKLDISTKQAYGGATALLNIAKDQLGGEEFSKITKAVPGFGKMTSSRSGGGSLISAGGSSSGDAAEAINLLDTFNGLGLDPALASQFLPIILDYATKVGGDAVGKLLSQGFAGVDKMIEVPAVDEETVKGAKDQVDSLVDQAADLVPTEKDE